MNVKRIKIIRGKVFVSWFFISIHSRDDVSASMSKQGSFSNQELLHRLGKRNT